MRLTSPSLSRLLKMAVVMTAAYSSAVMAANCTFSDSSTTRTATFGSNLAGKSLTVAADTPNGTVIYQDSVQVEGQSWVCTATSQFGMVPNPSQGTPTDSTTLFPLGKSGLSYRLWIDVLSRYEQLAFSLKASNYGIGAGLYRLEIVKTGELAAKIKVPSGSLGKLRGGELDLTLLNLSNAIVLNAASCQTPSVPVAMGDDYRLIDFDRAGATPRVVKFNIGLNDCQTGVKKVTYSLKATTQVINAQKGIVALNGTSTAKGLGLQLLNDAGQPLALDTTYTFSAFNTTGKNFNIPLAAAYYRLAEEVITAGSANTDVTFIISYL